MKFVNYLLGASLLTTLCCCKGSKSQNEAQDTILNPDFVLDSVRVNDSLKINDKLTLVYNKKMLIFDGLDALALLDSLYHPASIRPNSFNKKDVLDALSKDKSHYLSSDSEVDFSYVDFPQKWDEVGDMTLYKTINNYTIIKYLSSGFSGGAHGYYNEIYKVFDFKNKKNLGLSDVVKNPKDVLWSSILMKAMMQQNKDAAPMLLVQDIPLSHNFYFDQDKITFVYNQYEITAYAAGVQYIILNYEDIINNLKPEFIRAIK